MLFLLTPLLCNFNTTDTLYICSFTMCVSVLYNKSKIFSPPKNPGFTALGGVAVGPMEDACTEVLIRLEELTLQGRAERASRESHV